MNTFTCIIYVYAIGASNILLLNILFVTMHYLSTLCGEIRRIKATLAKLDQLGYLKK